MAYLSRAARIEHRAHRGGRIDRYHQKHAADVSLKLWSVVVCHVVHHLNQAKYLSIAHRCVNARFRKARSFGPSKRQGEDCGRTIAEDADTAAKRLKIFFVAQPHDSPANTMNGLVRTAPIAAAVPIQPTTRATFILRLVFFRRPLTLTSPNAHSPRQQLNTKADSVIILYYIILTYIILCYIISILCYIILCLLLLLSLSLCTTSSSKGLRGSKRETTSMPLEYNLL